MKNTKIYYLSHVCLIFMLLILTSCTSFNEHITKEANDSMYEDNWLVKYIDNVLYVGMSEEEFVKLFTRTSDWTDANRPYIKKHVKNYYIVSGLNTSYVGDCRITFSNGLLVKYDRFGWGKIPIIDSGYTDLTSFLKGYKVKNSPGFYDGMSEDEFLQSFAGSVLSHSDNRYVIMGKNGRKYRVTFKDSYLIGMDIAVLISRRPVRIE